MPYTGPRVPATRVYPSEAHATFQILRQARVISGTATAAIMKELGTYNGLFAQREVVVDTPQGAPVRKSIHEFIAPPYAQVREGDDLRRLDTGERFKVIKTNRVPRRIIIWAEIERAL